MAIVFDGNKLALEKEAALKRQVAKLKQKPKLACQPMRLVIVLVGDNPASQLYVTKKKETGERVGIKVEVKKFPASANQAVVINFIKEKNADSGIDGLIIQLPLPEKFDELKIRRSIDPRKDVDCLHPKNLGLVLLGRPRFYPAAVKAVLAIIFAVPPSRSPFGPPRRRDYH